MWKSFVLELHGEWCEFADECIALWLSKNSLDKNPQKIDRVRMPYKRFVGLA